MRYHAVNSSTGITRLIRSKHGSFRYFKDLMSDEKQAGLGQRCAGAGPTQLVLTVLLEKQKVQLIVLHSPVSRSLGRSYR